MFATWKSVQCPKCKARRGYPCRPLERGVKRGKGNPMKEPHAERRDAARARKAVLEAQMGVS
jgi:hypothetical protein